MARRLCFAFAVSTSLALLGLAHAQDSQPGSATTLLAQAGPSSTDATGASASDQDELSKLRAENATLKKEVSDAAQTIAQLQSQLAQAGVHPAAAASASTGPMKALPLDATNVVASPAAPGAPAIDTTNARSYTVVKGDSLWKIAHKMYPGDTKNGVDKIQEANKDAIGTKPLKIGQVLIIPQ